MTYTSDSWDFDRKQTLRIIGVLSVLALMFGFYLAGGSAETKAPANWTTSQIEAETIKYIKPTVDVPENAIVVNFARL